MKTFLLAAMIAMTTTAVAAPFVRVPDAPLLWTEQLLPRDLSRDAAGQMDELLDQLGGILARAGGDLTRVARLNVYVADESAVAAVQAVVDGRLGGKPAMTLVRTPVAKAGARVACDAVALVTSNRTEVQRLEGSGSVLPAGGKIFISGQAVKGDDLGAAVKLTMAGLHRSVAHLGLKQSDIVQVKAFIKPLSDHAAAMREIAASFQGAPAPPLVLIEWVSDLFAEIELVVSARALPVNKEEKIAYAWLPWLTKSTRYCNVTHVAAGTPLIFIGAIDGDGAAGARAQMKTIFQRLGSTLFEAGSSFRHMAKATYYLADPAARTLLGEIRDVYYDPARPPAASALDMNGLGYAGRTAMIDIIAVPAR